MRRLLITFLSLGILLSGCSQGDRVKDVGQGCPELRKALLGEWYYFKDPRHVLSIKETFRLLITEGNVEDSVGIEIIDKLNDCSDTLAFYPPSKLFYTARSNDGGPDTTWLSRLDTKELVIARQSHHAFVRVRNDPGSIAYRWLFHASFNGDTIRVAEAYEAARTWVDVRSMDAGRLIGDGESDVRGGNGKLGIVWFKEVTGVSSHRIAFLYDHYARRILDGIIVQRDDDVDYSGDSFSSSQCIMNSDTIMVVEREHIITDRDSYNDRVIKEVGWLYLPTPSGFKEVGIRQRTKYIEDIRWEEFK
ncbi:MAG: hypothetical protein IPF59_11900 [Ignavibacteria bacterium]|nr:hypothetical protein [Ignavibacteria bacterium]